MGWIDEQTRSGILRLGEITDPNDLANNLTENAIPPFIREVNAARYREFLEERRKLMADMIRRYYEAL